MASHHGGPPVAEVVKESSRASVVVNEASRGPVNNEIVVANREREVAVVPPGAQVINEVTTTEVFPHGPGYGYGYGPGPVGFQLCSQCRRSWHSSFSETVCYRCRSSYSYRDRFDDRYSYRSGYSSSYGYGSERCSYCERLRFEGRGGVGICRDRCGRPALCRTLPRRVLVEKKTVKKYYY
ncbi:hypothetical protein CORC01_09263 [Colletotrichum orchidophilum]|uniref:Uncharacterized protein n=1 Tax=Colletotrichum orchidophilum TaxID=1209926 RepID=A0A1G4B1X3_9PEZI|nr:uncharacterized protein CORC01_09263 [Colletotrichum orchidophilum]OHE95391.1 hypothetical protein CORC01_09263 [Colletotrichum orchidophilum]